MTWNWLWFILIVLALYFSGMFLVFYFAQRKLIKLKKQIDDDLRRQGK